MSLSKERLKITKVGFPLSRNFHVTRHVNFTRLKKMEAMFERPRVNVKVERGSTFTFTRDLPTLPLFYLSA